MYCFQNYWNFDLECKQGKYKTAYWAWKVTRTFEKQAPGSRCSKAGKCFPLINLYLEGNAIVFPDTVEPHLTVTLVIRPTCYYGDFFSTRRMAIHFLIKKNHLLIHTCQLSRFSQESPSFSSNLPVRAPNLPDKMEFWAFLCFSLKFSPFFHKIRTFCIHCKVSGTFLQIFSQWQRFCSSLQWWKRILIPHTSCKMSYNVLRQFVGGGGGVGGLVRAVDIRGGVVQNRDSPDFTSPEVGRYVNEVTS